MVYFTPDFFSFFEELRLNNDREWFQTNKTRYEKSVKLPFERFITDTIDRLQLIDPNFNTTAKEAIFRIYRDTRFSNDKTPYKLHVSAVLSNNGRNNPSASAGIYLELNDEGIGIYSGVYQPDTKQLKSIREAIASNLEEFERLIKAPDFLEKFGGTIHGEQAKRLPKEFAEAATKQPLLYNKAFYYFKTLDRSVMIDGGLVDRVAAYYKTAQPLAQFFRDAIAALRQ